MSTQLNIWPKPQSQCHVDLWNIIYAQNSLLCYLIFQILAAWLWMLNYDLCSHIKWDYCTLCLGSTAVFSRLESRSDFVCSPSLLHPYAVVQCLKCVTSYIFSLSLLFLIGEYLVRDFPFESSINLANCFRGF